MLIWEYPTVDAEELRRLSAGATGGAEIFAREDREGAIVLAGGGKAAGHPVEKSVNRLFADGRFGPEAGDWLFCVGLWTPEEFRGEFLAWYQVEHLPMLLECPVWDGCRFVEEKVREGCQFYALHQLSAKAALDSEARKRSRSTPWFKRLARNDWFDGPFSRTLCRRIA